MANVDFIERLHTSTKRDYVQRVVEHDKAACAEIALQWGSDYWDGERQFGYGGYRYDGRWRAVAQAMVDHYQLSDDAGILDVGCGKAFLLYEFTQVLPNATVAGVDISSYAIENAKEEVRPFLQEASATDLPFDDKSFDLVYSINTLHNLYVDQLWLALGEIQRVGRKARHVTVEAYRNEREKANLLYWQLTCRAFHTPAEWEWILEQTGFVGDYAFIYFE
ncbi:MAG: class I SAM-dependent methyltransferase [Pirellulaceae bacterium]|jgi:protein-L-isoaspartate(D-aspartate) O-methyltransferase|nr:class I SAM-dependent methyltransferase [Pirellulaceae bacterium]